MSILSQCKLVGKASRPAFSILVCPDSALLLEHIAAMLSACPPSTGDWERHVFWGDEPPGANFWESLGQQGLFPVYRAVIVRNAQEWPSQAWKNIDAALASSCSQIWPVLCIETAFEKGRPKIPALIQKSKCFQYAEKSSWIWTQPPLASAALSRYTREQAEKLGLRFAPGALELFTSAVMPDASSVKNELEKLALVVKDNLIKPEMIEIAQTSPEADAFRCIRMIIDGNLPGAWLEMERSGDPSFVFFLLALMAREFRLYWQILSGQNPRLHPREASVKKSLAEKMGFSKIAEGFSLLADAEWGIKSGRQTPEQTLHQLTVRLSTLYSGKRA